MWSFRKPYEYICNPVKKCLNKVCPCIRKLIFSRRNEHRHCKRFFGFFYGLLLGLFFYEFIILELNFKPIVTVCMGLVIAITLAFSIAFSRQIRCIALLSLPTFGGRAGRRVLRTMILTYLISGPISNMSFNAREVARSYACSMSLTYNLTKTRFTLMFAPIQNALFNMKLTIREVKETIKSIKDVAAPITAEIEDEGEISRLKEHNDYFDDMVNDSRRSREEHIKYEKKGQNQTELYRNKYMEKIELRCEDQLTSMTLKCRGAFEKMYDTCYDTVTFLAAWILCWPMKITYVCNLAQALGQKVCDPSKEIDPGLGEGYSFLKGAQGLLGQKFKDVNLQYKVQKVTQFVKTAQNTIDITKSILHEIGRKKYIVDEVLDLLKRLLAFVFIQIILSAQSYHDKYLKNIEFDNRYITKYFRKIDARRHKEEKYTVLPLKKVEKEKYVDPLACRCLRREKKLLLSRCFKLALEMITATVFILIDRLFYESLDLIRRHAKIEFHQEGHHELNIEVRGTGLIAALIRAVIRGFNVKKRVRTIRSNVVCLPRPKILRTHFLLRIYGTYTFLFLTIIAEVYIRRLKPVICGYYYRKKQKRRILYLYNDLLRKRVNFFRTMQKRVARLIREDRLGEERGLKTYLVGLMDKYPRGLCWLKVIPFVDRHCFICREMEPFSFKVVSPKFVQCPKCKNVFCLSCWRDLEEICFYCLVSSEGVDSDHETDSETD